MGLHVMKHRAGVIGAELTVDSRPGKGVTITCRWPEPT
jgi:signal transduction histidine kinase